MPEAIPPKVIGRLRGFSGSQIEICRHEGVSFVRKYVADPARLMAEVGKLEGLRVPNGLLFCAPQVGSAGAGYYDMEYIRGRTLEEHLQTCPVAEVVEWAERCGQIVVAFTNRAVWQRPEDSASLLKDMLCATIDLGIYPRLRELEAALPAWLPGTFSHGDLTLDNMLVTPDGELYLIDPGQQQVETYQWDIAKLLQSCYADWWQIRGIHDDRSHRLRLFARALLEKLPAHDLALSALFLGLVLLRIVKYAKTAEQKDTLVQRACVMFDQYLGERPLFSMEDTRWT